jgi:PAS domain S-box-containing protein
MVDSRENKAQQGAFDTTGRLRRAGKFLAALPAWSTYLFALAITGATFLTRWSLGFATSDYLMLVIYTIPVILSAYAGGLGPGLFSTAIATITAKYFFIPTIHSLVFDSQQPLVAWLCLLAAGITISCIVEALHQTQHELEVDISKRQQAQEALRASEDRLRVIADNTYDWEYWRAPDGNYLWVSPSCERITGHPPEELLGEGGEKILHIIHPDDRHLWEAHLKEVDSLHPEHRELDFRIVKPAGEVVWISHICKPIFAGDGTFLGRRGCNHEITGRKLAEERVLEAMQQAQAASKAKSEFLANMSHEIRTPLNGIMGMLQILEMTPLEDDVKIYLQTAIKSSARLNQLLNDILDLSRIEADRLTITESEFVVSDLHDSLAELFSVAAREKNIELHFTCDERVPAKLLGDETRLLQILFNIVGNAIKFTEHGSVDVDVFLLPYADDSQVRLLFTVKDTGIGIPDHLVKDVFEPFTQVNGTYTRPFQGAGLGLSIVRKLVVLLHGELAVDSVEGDGTTFYLTLPFKIPGTPPGHAASAAPAASLSAGADKRVLLVEDDAMNLMTGRRMLEKSGYDVVTAVNGREALDRLSEQDFSLILMDIQMPVMNGVEAARAIRRSSELGAKAATPIIALTAHAMAGDREKFLAAGIDDYVAKPVEMDTLRDVIRKVADRGAAR